MGYVPPNAMWYVAELIEEIRVEGHDENVVHRNLVLVRADSPDSAYVRAIQIGNDGEISYENPAGQAVTFRFRGLGHLDVIHDVLEDGAELLYTEDVSVSEETISGWVRSKDQLALFRDPVREVDVPDYSSKEIVDEAKKLIEGRSKS